MISHKFLLSKPTFLIAVLLGLTVQISAQTRATRTIAVTIDDLPVVSTRRDLGHRQEITRKLLSHIKKAKVPAIGFLNENKLYNGDERQPAEIALLEMWLDAGLELGNHSFSHRSLNRIELADFQNDVVRGEEITRGLLHSRGKRLRYFRHPFLHTGRTLEVKAAFDNFLKERGYVVAPITFDNADYIFARAYDIALDRGDKELLRKVGGEYVPYMERKLEYWERQSMKLFGREVSQTMIIHSNLINAEYFGDLARMLKRRGYKFVDLETALKNDAYRNADTYIGPAGISWLHRWAREKGREYILPNEPKVPDFVMKLSGFESE